MQVVEGGEKLDFLHKTQVEDVPGAITAFQVRHFESLSYKRLKSMAKYLLLMH